MTAQHLTQQQIYLDFISSDDAANIIDLELASRLSEKEIKLPVIVKGDVIIGAFIGNDLKGFFINNMVGERCVEVHIGFPKENRILAKESARQYMDMMFESFDVDRIETEIPTCYPDVIRFTQNMGFKNEGTKRKNFSYKNEMHDSQIMGILRGEHGQGC